MNASFQTSYPTNMPRGVAGRIADCGFKNTLSPFALEAIPPAIGVMKPLNLDYRIMLPRNNTASSVFSEELVLGNVINATVNGVAITPVNFAGTALATMQAIADEIEEIPTVESATVGGAGNLTITIVSVPGTATAVTAFAVTGGATQAAIVTTAGQSGVFFGVTQYIYDNMGAWLPPIGPNLSVTGGPNTPYYEGSVVPTLTQGRIYVTPEDIVTSNSPVYMRIAASGANTQLGAFTGTSDGANTVLIPAAQAIWREGNLFVGDVAVLEINLP